MAKLKIYKASAGSGKTYSLTEEYLRLAAKHPNDFKRILAVTFTNKAAEEMKQRILEALNEIADNAENASFYNVFENAYKNKTQFEIIKNVKETRDSILHDYSYFSLSTIDSFVQKVIKSFTYEIGVENAYKIELDTDKVIKEITDILYKQIDEDEELKKWLVKFANYKMDDGKDWDFRSEIHKLAKELFKEKFETKNKQESSEEEYKEISQKFDQIYKIRKSFEEKINKIAKDASDIFNKQQYRNNNYGRNIGFLKGYFTKKIPLKIKIEDYVPNKTVREMLDNLDAWTAKSASANIKEAAGKLYEQLNPLLNQAIFLIEKDYQYYLAAFNVLSIFHAYGILRKLASLLPEYRSQNNVLMISDTTRLLKDIIEGNEAPFIYEKIGNRYQHILIDEFQDTSGFQWSNFKPLIKNNLSENNSNLIVGDIKQSIYRWRGGDWNLLLSEVDNSIGKFYIENKTLETNWRSKKNVVDFNNAFFKIASDSLQNLFDSELNIGNKELMDEDFKSQYDNIINKAYSDIFQQLPEDKLGGQVKIKFYEQKGRKKSEWKEQALNNLPQTIENLIVTQKYKPSDLAILVRRNNEGQDIANCLFTYQYKNEDALKYPIISSESLMLINSAIIQILINAMHYIYNTNDNVRLHALTTIYNKAFYAEKEINNDFYSSKKVIREKKLLPTKFLNNLTHFKKLNIFELTEELSRIFSLNTLQTQLIYLQSFQDLLLDYTKNNSSDLDSFLQWWEEKGVKNSIKLSDEQDALKILTIHKSKGLAFKVVLIPFCDWPLKPSSINDLIIWTESEIEPFNKLGKFPVVFRKYLQNSTLYKEYYEELLYSFIDAINMLYVAFTRAKDELIVMTPYKESKSASIDSVADLLYAAIKTPLKYENIINLNEFYNKADNLFELKQNIGEVTTREKETEPSEIQAYDINDYVLTDWQTKLKIQRNAPEFFAKDIEYIQEKINYGTLMHKILAKIKTEKDIDKLIKEIYYEGKIDTEEAKQLRNKIAEIINRPKVKDWFSDKWQIKNEDAILNKLGQIRIPDRVLIGDNETIVIDYKFGKQQDSYKSQLKQYMDLLKSMNYQNVKAYIYYVEQNIVKNVI